MRLEEYGVKPTGYADGTEENPDGTRMCAGSETCIFRGEAWELYRLMELGLIPSPEGAVHHPVEGWFNS